MKRVKLAFLMALHPRAGAVSTLFKVLQESAIADPNSILGIWDALFAPRPAYIRSTRTRTPSQSASQEASDHSILD